MFCRACSITLIEAIVRVNRFTNSPSAKGYGAYTRNITYRPIKCQGRRITYLGNSTSSSFHWPKLEITSTDAMTRFDGTRGLRIGLNLRLRVMIGRQQTEYIILKPSNIIRTFCIFCNHGCRKDAVFNSGMSFFQPLA